MLRVIIYARVSTEDQLEKYGLPAQLRACRERAIEKQYAVVEEIAEDATGATLDRAGLERLRERVSKGEADVVLCLDVDRLSRELGHLLILKPELEKHAQLEFVLSTFENSPNGRLFFGIKGVVGQYERELVRERTMRGKREKARAGRYVGAGRTAYGYCYQAGVLAIDPERAPFVRQIYEWFLSGVPVRRIALRLREAGVPTWAGRTWAQSSVRRILLNETYAGVAHFLTTRREGSLLRLRDPRERIAIAVPAIVAHELWDRAQTKLHAGAPKGRPTVQFLLRGILYCSCGRRMSGNRSHGGRTQYHYRCHGRDPLMLRGERCTHGLNGNQVDACVWRDLEGIFTDTPRLRAILRAYQSDLLTAAPEKTEALARQVRTLQAREERCLSMLLDTDLVGARETLKRKYVEAQRERQALDRELANLERARAKQQSMGDWLESTVDLLRGYVPTLTEPAARQEFVQGLVSRVDWDGGLTLKLTCFLGAKCAQPEHVVSIYDGLQIVLNVRLAA